MVMALGRLVTAAEAAARAAKTVQELRKAGQTEAATALEQECTRVCRGIVRTAQKRRAAAARARSQSRNQSGRFS